MHTAKQRFRLAVRYFRYFPSMVATHFVKSPLSWSFFIPVLLMCFSIYCFCYLIPNMGNLHMFGLSVIPFCICSIIHSRSSKHANLLTWLFLLVSLVGGIAFFIYNHQFVQEMYNKLITEYPAISSKQLLTVTWDDTLLYSTVSFSLPFSFMVTHYTRLVKLYSHTPFPEWNDYNVEALRLNRFRFVIAELGAVSFVVIFASFIFAPAFGIILPNNISKLILIVLGVSYLIPHLIQCFLCSPKSIYSNDHDCKLKVSTALGRHLFVLTHFPTPYEEIIKQSVSTIVSTICCHIRNVVKEFNYSYLPYFSCILCEYAKKLIQYKCWISFLRSKKTKIEIDRAFGHFFFAIGMTIASLSEGISLDAQRYRNMSIRKMVNSLNIEPTSLHSLKYGYAIGELYQVVKNKDVHSDVSFKSMLSDSMENLKAVLKKPPVIHYDCLVSELTKLNKTGDKLPQQLLQLLNKKTTSYSPSTKTDDDVFRTIVSGLVDKKSKE